MNAHRRLAHLRAHLNPSVAKSDGAEEAKSDGAEEEDNTLAIAPGWQYVSGAYAATRWREGFDGPLSGARVVACGEGWTCMELVVEKRHLNMAQNLHGGMSMTIIDSLGTTALYTLRPGANSVSVSLSTTFTSPAREGDTLSVTSKVVKHGRKMVFIHVDIANKADGALVASGTHVKKII